MGLPIHSSGFLSKKTGISLINLNLSCYFYLFFLWLFVMSCYADKDLGTDTILQGRELRDGEYLDSPTKMFRLQFFSPDSRSNSNNRYLCIIYNYNYNDNLPHDNVEKTVWVANRNNPIPNKSGTLMIDSNDGMLKISHSGGKSIILSTSTTVGSRNRSATLLDDGNFVLREMNPDGSINGAILWQSFDYPTDKLLPGMKLGINFTTGHKWSLTSWISQYSPATGSFTVGVDPKGKNQLIMWWRDNVWWTSGVWHNDRFENTPDFGYINFSYIVNQNEKYFTYSVKGNNYEWVMFGLFADGSFKGKGEEGILSDCYSSTPGCVKRKLPECREGNPVSFGSTSKAIYGVSYRVNENYNLSIYDCWEMCRQNCSCGAFATIYNDETGCEIWSKDEAFSISKSEGHRSIYIVEAKSHSVAESQSVQTGQRAKRKPKTKTKWRIWLIAALCGTLLPLAILCYFLWRNLRVKRKRKGSKKPKLGKLGDPVAHPGKHKTAKDVIVKKLGFWCYSLQKNLRLKGKKKEAENELLGELVDTIKHPGKYNKAIDQIEKKMNQVQLFSFASIQMATNNFSPANKLGEGGFGPVYKGELPGGQEIAIKRLSRNSGQGLVEFKNEIMLIAKLQHNNLVRLIGYCNQGQEKMLVYEYMPNKSLDFFLFDPSRRQILKWTHRMNIIEGIAQGLLYLHKYSRLRVIHRDLKASNILLDQYMNPKISDFGMARIFGKQESETNTKRIVGTHGYMSPEYFIKGIVSAKTDVFSFGVLLLEIVSGKKNHSSYHSERPLNLIGLAWELWIEGRESELMDTTILEDSNQKNKVRRYINIGLLCVQDNAADRPSMVDVVSMLNNEFLQLQAPKQPAFFIKTNTPEVEIEVASDKNCTNGLSISVMKAR